MASELDEALYWAGKASDAHHNVLETVQASAGKWQAAIAAFLGAYATVGFVVGPATLASLPPATGLLTSPAAPYAVLVTHSGAYCGRLTTTGGAAFVRVPGGRRIPVAGGTITVVSACGGS